MEIFKDVEGYEGLYQISNIGRLKLVRFKKNRISVKKPCKDGYCRMLLRKNKLIEGVYIHRLVAKAFIPNNQEYPEVNHINGIKNDNRVENLEWCTSSENQKHAVKTKLQITGKGENSPYNILTESDVISIRKNYSYKKNTMRMLSLEYGVSLSTIQSVLNRTNWNHV